MSMESDVDLCKFQALVRAQTFWYNLSILSNQAFRDLERFPIAFTVLGVEPLGGSG